MARGLELVWPGKYGPDGERTPVPRRQPTLRTDCIVAPGTSSDGSTEQLGLGLSSGARPAAEVGAPDRLILADNLLALDALEAELAGQVDLVVMDPPFSTGSRFDVVTRVGEGPSPAEVRSPAYSDSWDGGPAGLIAMLDPRLRLVHALLAAHGSLYIHVDPIVGHAVKLLLDDVFGPECFQREIVWRIGWVSGFKTKARNWIRNHDLIYFYVKDPKRFTFNKRYVPYPEGYTRRDGSPPRGQGVPLDDVWNANEVEHELRGPDSLDSIQIKSFSHEKTGFATQKNESLLRRIIEASSNAGELVLDPFCGSGTTLAVARAAGRRCIGIDTSRAAAQISLRRLLDHGARPLALQHLRPDERRTAELSDGALLAHADAEPTVSPGLDGVRGEVGVVVRERWDDGALRELAAEHRGEVEALGWGVGVVLPLTTEGPDVLTGVPAGFGGTVTPVLIGRELLGPRPRPREGLLPLAVPRLRVSASATGASAGAAAPLRIELLGIDEGWPAARPPGAAELPTAGLDLVDGWGIDPDFDPARTDSAPTGGASTLTFIAFRRHHRRALTTIADVPARGCVRVRVWDVLHRVVDVILVLAPDGERVRVAQAELVAGSLDPITQRVPPSTSAPSSSR